MCFGLSPSCLMLLIFIQFSVYKEKAIRLDSLFCYVKNFLCFIQKQCRQAIETIPSETGPPLLHTFTGNTPAESFRIPVGLCDSCSLCAAEMAA